jgi:putative spermidine/putrescine transport system permease protein
VWITFVYLWMPFTLLPVYAALERVHSSFLEASADLGAKGWTTFRSVVLPLILPGVVAGSIFAFSLTLGDYITPELVGNTQFIGNVIFDNVGVAGNLPLAAAYALVPVAILAVYLFAAKRAGAFEAL